VDQTLESVQAPTPGRRRSAGRNRHDLHGNLRRLHFALRSGSQRIRVHAHGAQRGLLARHRSVRPGHSHPAHLRRAHGVARGLRRRLRRRLQRARARCCKRLLRRQSRPDPAAHHGRLHGLPAHQHGNRERHHRHHHSLYPAMRARGAIQRPVDTRDTVRGRGPRLRADSRTRESSCGT